MFWTVGHGVDAPRRSHVGRKTVHPVACDQWIGRYHVGRKYLLFLW